MRFQLDETIRILDLTGRVVSRSNSMALVEFGQAGFLQVAYPVEGDHDAVIMACLPKSIVSPQSLPELRRQVCLTFDIHPDSRVAIKLCEPLRFGTAPSPPVHIATPQSQSSVYPAELVTPDNTSGGSAEDRYHERFGNNWESADPTYGQRRDQWQRYGENYHGAPITGSLSPGSQGMFLHDLVDRWNLHFETEPEEELYSVPRRYDLASMFAISVAYALLFSFTKILGWPPSLIFLSGIFCAIVGAAQALMFGGKRPREASIIAGGVAGVLCSIAFPLVEGYGTSDAVLSAMCGVVWCPVAGYLTGTTIGGIWLTADYLRRWSEAKRVAKEQAKYQTGKQSSHQTDGSPNGDASSAEHTS